MGLFSSSSSPDVAHEEARGLRDVVGRESLPSGKEKVVRVRESGITLLQR